jgi:hypothetical protein
MVQVAPIISFRPKLVIWTFQNINIFMHLVVTCIDYEKF